MYLWISKQLLTGVCRLLYWTYRIKFVVGAAHYEHAQTLHPRGSVAIALWHQNAFAAVMAMAWRRIAMLVSHSQDGELTTHVGHQFGFLDIRGSSSRGTPRRRIFESLE